MRKLVPIVTAAVALALGLAPAASAATTCEVDTGQVLNVDMTTTNSNALVAVGPSGDIQVRGTGPVLTCANAQPTLATISTILVVDDSDDPTTPTANDGNNQVSIIDPTLFLHGATPIGWVITFNKGFNDELFAETPAANPSTQHWVLGDGGINFFADVSSSAQVLMDVPEHVEFAAGPGTTTYSGQGGSGTGAPYDRAGSRVDFEGFTGNDTFDGSENGDILRGGAGDDVLRGHGGDDALAPGPGNDIVDGAAGTDTVDYGDVFTAPVQVDLSQTGPQNTGGAGTDTITGVENASGTSLADTLVGDAGPNVLIGNGGKDTLVGGLGDDQLGGSGLGVTVDYSHAAAAETVDLTAGTATGGDGNDTVQNVDNVVGSPFGDMLVGNAHANVVTGGAGNDTIATLAGADTVNARDGGPDTVSCGADSDSATADQRSVDQVNADCENVDFLPETTTTTTTGTTGAGGTTGGGGTTTTGGPAGTLPVARATSLSFGLRVAHAQHVLRQKGVVVKVTCPDEACTAIVGTTGSLRGLRSGIRPATSQVAAGVTKTLRVRLTRKQLRLLRTALRHHKHAVLTLTVDGVDASGNVVTRTVRVRVER